MSCSSLHIFDVFQHPDRGMVAVRRGFSWEAFLLPALWSARRGLGTTTLVLFVLSTVPFDLARYAASFGLAEPAQILLAILGLTLVGIVPGTEGHRWHARHLRHEGFVHQQTVAASNRQQALLATRNQAFEGTLIPVAA